MHYGVALDSIQVTTDVIVLRKNLAIFQRIILTSYSKLCNENFREFTDSVAVVDKIDVSHYLQHVVVFMYIVYKIMVKRLCSIYIFT